VIGSPIANSPDLPSILSAKAHETRKRRLWLLSDLTDEPTVGRNQPGVGNLNRNRAPPNGDDSTVSVPPCASSARRLIASPSAQVNFLDTLHSPMAPCVTHSNSDQRDFAQKRQHEMNIVYWSDMEHA
jgi:hypothetical protein